jgi:hypothetical protein
MSGVQLATWKAPSISDCSKRPRVNVCSTGATHPHEASTSVGSDRRARALQRLADFFHRDFVLKVIGVERIDPSLRGFGLRVHEVHHRFVGGSG